MIKQKKMTNNNEQTIKQFRFSIPIPMRWNDLDGLGHVNNIYYSNIFKLYVENISQQLAIGIGEKTCL